MTNVKTKNEFAVKDLVSFLSDPQLYSDAPTLTQRSKFGLHIPKFYKQFFADLDHDDLVRYGRIFIIQVKEKVKFQIAFRYFVDAILENKLFQVIDETVLNAVYAMTDDQIIQQPPAQRNRAYMMVLSFIEVENTEFGLLKLKLAAKIPRVPKSINLNLEEAKGWIRESLKISYEGKSQSLEGKELGLLIKNSHLTNEELKDLISPYIGAISSIYRNTYIDKSVALLWNQELSSTFLYISHDAETRQHFYILIESIIEEVISYAFTLVEDSHSLPIFLSCLEVYLRIMGNRHVSKLRNHCDFLLKQISNCNDVALLSYLSYLKLFLSTVILI